MDGAEYVEVIGPKNIRHRYPLVLFHGAGQTGTGWLQTPDGRPSWAYSFPKQGYSAYMVNYPARTRWPGEGPSKGPNKGEEGRSNIRQICQDLTAISSRWKAGQSNLDTHRALPDMIGYRVILLTHSQGCEFGWQITDGRPKLVKALITGQTRRPAHQGSRHREGRL